MSDLSHNVAPKGLYMQGDTDVVGNPGPLSPGCQSTFSFHIIFCINVADKMYNLVIIAGP